MYGLISTGNQILGPERANESYLFPTIEKAEDFRQNLAQPNVWTVFKVTRLRPVKVEIIKWETV